MTFATSASVPMKTYLIVERIVQRDTRAVREREPCILPRDGVLVWIVGDRYEFV